MTQQQISATTGPLGASGNLKVYTVPGSVIVEPVSAAVIFDGSGAAGNFIPCLTFKTQTGAIIARCPAPEVAAGDTAEVSWFPSVGQTPSGSGGSGVQFDTQSNVGGYLDIYPTSEFLVKVDDGSGSHSTLQMDNDVLNTRLVDPGVKSSIGFDTGGWGVTVNDDGSTNDTFGISAGGFDVHLAGGTSFRADQAGGSWLQQAGDIQIAAAAGDIFLNLPTVDPGVSGALWNNAGIVTVSP